MGILSELLPSLMIDFQGTFSKRRLSFLVRNQTESQGFFLIEGRLNKVQQDPLIRIDQKEQLSRRVDSDLCTESE